VGRKKKHFNIMDENATKSRVIIDRITPVEHIRIEQLKHKLGLSGSEIRRIAMKEFYKKHFPGE
jgi:hypothetical protein